ncbi:sensor histidine kinase [soil metagenome]
MGYGLAMPSSDGLAEFIDRERTPIVAEWEAFARTLLPAAGGMSGPALRDHADQILSAIIKDMKSRQSEAEQSEKSKGRGQAKGMGDIGKVHAALRIGDGFKVGQLVAEYRALRASVLRLWEKGGTDPGGVTRFNEAIDEALTEAIENFTSTTEHFRGQSLGILSHDLRNPLAAIVMGATILVDTEALDDHTVRIAARMLTSAKRMDRMISDLLDLTRSRFGDRIPIVPVAIDLEPLCRHVIAELEGRRPAGELRFEARGDLHGEWDADRIAQLLSNLVSNALQYGAASDPVEVVAAESGDDVILTVHNGGLAIPANALRTMFDPMVRHSTDVKTSSGLGLGLYIAAQVVIAHGGTIDVASTDADGTTFTVRLPRHAHSTTSSAGVLVLKSL